MARQNITGKPRIYVDYLQYHNAIGNISGWHDFYAPMTPGGDIIYTPFAPQNASIFMNPLSPAKNADISINPDSNTLHYSFYTDNPMYGMNFYGMLGHNMGGIPVGPFMGYVDLDAVPESGDDVASAIFLAGSNDNSPVSPEIINFQVGTGGGNSSRYGTPRLNGFSLWKIQEISADDAYQTIGGQEKKLTYNSCTGSSDFYSAGVQDNLGETEIGFSPVCGRIFDFEHAPDLKLTMTREFDGVKRQKTIGGADISNTTFLGGPNWPLSGNPWTLTSPTLGHKSSPYYGGRIGRRVWDLKFSMLSDTSIMPLNEHVTAFGVDIGESAGYVQDTDYTGVDSNEDDAIDYGLYNSDFWTDDSFIGLVFGKTMGFSLPFIFQPDSDNNSADQFAMCKIDNKSLRITQTSFKKYDISLKIREVW